MRDHFEFDWAFALHASLQDLIQRNKPEEVHRWPLLRAFNHESYVWRDSHLIIILRDKLSGIPAGGAAKPAAVNELPKEAPTGRNIDEWQAAIRRIYGVGPRDMAIIIPILDGGRTPQEDWDLWTEADKELWNLQLQSDASRHLAYLMELDARKGLPVTAVPPEISESLQTFRRDHPDAERTGFLMMRLTQSTAHSAITRAVRETAAAHGVTIVRADDKDYHADLFPNVLTYIHGSGFGIAVFERIEEEVFNPNVSLEVGYMLALRKPVCFLKDRTLQALQTDLLGKLYRTFEPHRPHSAEAAHLGGRPLADHQPVRRYRRRNLLATPSKNVRLALARPPP